MTLGQPSRERVLWEPEVFFTAQPMRNSALRTLFALVALNRSGSGRHDEGHVRRLLGRHVAILELFGDGVEG